MLVDLEWLELVGAFEGALVHEGLVFELLAQGCAMADEFGHELAFHSAFVLEEELFSSIGIQIDSAIAVLEVLLVEHLVCEQVEGEGFDDYWAERLDEVEGK